MERTDEQKDESIPLAAQWGKRLDRALKEQREAKKEEKYKKYRKYVRGDVCDDGAGGLVRTNIVHSNFAAIIPQIYAKNPEIAVTPSESATDEAYPWVGEFCKTMQAVLNRKFIRDARLKKRAKASIRAAMTVEIGWAKVTWQKDISRDPLIESRIADVQDNLQRIQYLRDELAEGDGAKADLDAKEGELKQQIAALNANVEVTRFSGIVVDHVLTEDIFILDETMYEFDGYENAGAIAHRVWMTTEQYEQQFGKEPPKKATRFGQDKKTQGSNNNDAPLLVAVFETWDRASNTIYTLCAGADQWAREPYQPTLSGKRFYPFFGLAFNPIDGSVVPISDAALLIELQDEYNTTRTNFSEHRKENLPVRVFRNSGDLSDADVRNLKNRASNEWIGIGGDPNKPITNDVAVLPNPPVDPMTYDVAPILRDAELVLGAGDASKGTINKAKTATEAEIMAQGLQTRMAERQDVVEDWISEMAQYAAELCLQEMTLEDVQRIAGKGAVWPQMTKDQVFDLVQIEIRAGSTGKPNRAKEREQWVQMLPQIKEAVTQVAQLRAAGQDDMATTIIKLMEETLRRFDERLDIESFIPPAKAHEPDGQQPPQIPPEVQQALQQIPAMQDALQQLQAANQQLQAQLADKSQTMGLERDKFEYQKTADLADNEARIAEAQIRADADAAAKIEIERIRATSKGEEIASRERVEIEKARMAQEQAAMQQPVAQGAEPQVIEAVCQMHEALCAMSKQFADQMAALQAHLTAPKRVIRDPQTGEMIGVETVPHTLN